MSGLHNKGVASCQTSVPLPRNRFDPMTAVLTSQELHVAQSGEAWLPVQLVQTPVADTYWPLRHTLSAGAQSAAPGLRT